MEAEKRESRMVISMLVRMALPRAGRKVRDQEDWDETLSFRDWEARFTRDMKFINL